MGIGATLYWMPWVWLGWAALGQFALGGCVFTVIDGVGGLRTAHRLWVLLRMFVCLSVYIEI